jgi:hypothetical protein
MLMLRRYALAREIVRSAQDDKESGPPLVSF